MRSDLQVCAYGTGSGNLAVILKQFKRLGVRSWSELADMNEFLGQGVRCSVNQGYVTYRLYRHIFQLRQSERINLIINL